MWNCKHCNKEFDFTRTTEKANHSRHCSENPAKQASYEKGAEASRLRTDDKLGKLIEFTVKCHTCDGDHIVTERAKQFPKQEKYFCSRNCANSMGGKKKAELYHGDDVAHYTTVCFRHHEKKCVVCGEDKIVAVHHYNENHDDNTPSNLVPLCPTHHQYMHSRYKVEIQKQVDKYVYDDR